MISLPNLWFWEDHWQELVFNRQASGEHVEAPWHTRLVKEKIALDGKEQYVSPQRALLIKSLKAQLNDATASFEVGHS